jgi:hypothetical protein
LLGYPRHMCLSDQNGKTLLFIEFGPFNDLKLI